MCESIIVVSPSHMIIYKFLRVSDNVNFLFVCVNKTLLIFLSLAYA